MRRGARFVCAHSGGVILLGALRDVKREFIAEVAIELIALKE
jgi:hypothetical protein